jgi:hypothetical protein
MKRNLGMKKKDLQVLVEYKLEYREEQKRIEKSKRE